MKSKSIIVLPLMFGIAASLVVVLFIFGTRDTRGAAEARMEKLGDALFRDGSNTRAESTWREVLAAVPASQSVRNKLAILCMQEARYGEARALLEEGLRRDPEVVSYHFNLGLLGYMEKNYNAALESLSNVERMNRGHANVHYIKGKIYEALGEKELARREFVEELNVDPATPQAWVQLGVLPEGSQIKTWLRK